MCSNKNILDKKINRDIEKLKDRKLMVNSEKTEKLEINNTRQEMLNQDWKKCKYLGSLLDTENDIKRRKQTTNLVFNKYCDILQNKKLSLKVKLRIFNVYISSTFLYNSELWTMGKKTENCVDVFQRKLLKRLMMIHYPQIISNKELYERTRQESWSTEIKMRRLRWLGHLLRLDEKTPAVKAFEVARKKDSKKKKGNYITWMKRVDQDLKEVGLSLEDDNISLLAEDRSGWRNRVVMQQTGVPKFIKNVEERHQK